MYEQYKEGQMTKEEFLAMQKRHQERREVLEGEIQKKEDEISVKEKVQEAMQQIQAELRTAEILTEYDPKLVGQIVEKVIVYVGGKVELVMRNRGLRKIKGDEKRTVKDGRNGKAIRCKIYMKMI